MKASLIALILAITTFSFAGTSDISSQLRNLDNAKSLSDPIARDTQMIYQYNKIIEELSRNIDPRTEAYVDTLRQMAELSTWESALGFYYRGLGRMHDFKGEFEEALLYYEKAIVAFKPTSTDKKEIAFTYVLKGFLLQNSELYQECWKTLKEGLPYARQTKYKNSLCLMLDWFGDYYYYGMETSVDNESALEYYLQVEELLPSIDYARIIADNHACLSGVYNRTSQYEKADYHFAIADSICQEEKLNHVRWGLFAEKARALESSEQHKEANKIYLQASEFMENSTNIEFKARLEKALWANYKNIGDYEMALAHYENLTEMEEKMNISDVEKKYAEIEAKYLFTVKENEIAKLQKSKASIIRNLLIGLAGLSLIFGYYIKKKNNQLQDNYNQLEINKDEVERAIYSGETQERQRLSSELHDNVNTKIAAARWRLESIVDSLDDNAKSMVESTIQMMQEAYDDVRSVSHNLVPKELEKEGLIASIKNLIENLNIKSDVVFEIDSNDINENELSKIIYPVYNIVFELINNILKHANASSAKISIIKLEEQLSITIRDNGKGFDQSIVESGFGLMSIKNRVKSLKGTINIESFQQTGTASYINIPLY